MPALQVLEAWKVLFLVRRGFEVPEPLRGTMICIAVIVCPWIVPRKRSAVLCQTGILSSQLLFMRYSHNIRNYCEFAPPGSHMCSGYSELHVGASRMARRVILFEFS